MGCRHASFYHEHPGVSGCGRHHPLWDAAAMNWFLGSCMDLSCSTGPGHILSRSNGLGEQSFRAKPSCGALLSEVVSGCMGNVRMPWHGKERNRNWHCGFVRRRETRMYVRPAARGIASVVYRLRAKTLLRRAFWREV
jgi:hypothetical protein